ncbi:hypothetical protein INT44_000317 [Umbelopsis vinacea]|uniref:Magnesium transporter n=1 Tax=Umbelopsis vinacea TaxID=44442 RepID=A0A8H7UDV2_9FUNG|nr:hypothetical protein INT44_000317 [Umbelopsis vinacea]
MLPDKLYGVTVCVSLAASVIQAFAITLQRRSHIFNDAEPPELQRSAFRRPTWVAGFLMYTIANIIGSIFTIGYLPIVVLAPIGAMNLVFNAIFAKVMLGDPFTKRTAYGTALIVLGAVLIGGFGVVQEPNHTLEDLIQLYKRPAFIAYFAVVEFFIVAGLAATHIVENKYKRIQFSLTDQSIVSHTNTKALLGISYGVFGANISSQAMLFAKSGLELLILTIFQGQNQFIYPLTWLLVAALIVTALLQLYYLNKGISLCDTVILVPLNFCSFNVSCLFNGLMYYDQWERLFWWQIVCVLFGIVVLVSGVLVLSWRSMAGAIFLADDDDDNKPAASQ